MKPYPSSRCRPYYRSATRITVPALLAAMTAAGTVIALPLPGASAPFTLQVFFVLLSGAVAGPLGGATSMVVYLAIGAAGIPVFSMMRGGPGVLLGPTGGYLLAFPIAALVVGLLAGPRSGARASRTAFAMIAGILIIYLGGAVRLWSITRKPLPAVLATGVVPFIPADILKAVAAAAVASRMRRFTKN